MIDHRRFFPDMTDDEYESYFLKCSCGAPKETMADMCPKCEDEEDETMLRGERMTTHTPGPWHCDESFRDMESWTIYVPQSSKPNYVVAHCFKEADAKLIRAAPDLLKTINLAIGFCVNARQTWEDWEDHPDVGILFAKLVAAKEKATEQS